MARRNPTRWILTAAGAAVVAALLAFLLWPRPVAVDVGRAVAGPIDETVFDQGEVRVRNAYVVAAPVSGRLERLTLKVGDRVRQGDVVAYVRPSTPDLLDARTRAEREAAIASAQAAVGAARAQFESAAAEAVHADIVLSRTGALAAKGFASKQALDDAQAEARSNHGAQDAAAAQVKAREHDLAAARAALIGPEAPAAAPVPVRAPVSGWITHVLQESERDVAMGAQVLEVSASSEREAQIEFLSQDAVRIRVGMPAELYDWGGPGTIPARVRLIEPQGYLKISALGVEEQRALVMLAFTGDPHQYAALGPGYRVWGRVFLRRAASVLKVPLGALVRNAGGWAVFRVESGQARLRPVSVGVMTDSEAEILHGLARGDAVVVFPSDQVHDGAAVKPRSG
jgi:HlyD family secretion protein